MRQAWLDYLAADGEIRAAENSGNHTRAVQLNFGEANSRLDAFTTCAGELQAINQAHYAATASRAGSTALITVSLPPCSRPSRPRP